MNQIYSATEMSVIVFGTCLLPLATKYIHKHCPQNENRITRELTIPEGRLVMKPIIIFVAIPYLEIYIDSVIKMSEKKIIA